MTQKDLSIVTDTAYRVRYFGELFQKSNSYDFNKDLTGMCGICAYYLFRTLKRKGLFPVYSSNLHHSFVYVEDYVVDVTATQFEGITDKILIRKMPFSGWKKHWFVLQHATQYREIPKLFDDWISGQSPFYFSTREERKDLLTLWKYVASEDIKKVIEKVSHFNN